MRIVEAGSVFKISFDYDPRIIAEVKRIPGRWYDGGSKAWIVPATSSSEVEMLRGKYCIDEKYLAPEEVGEIPPMPELTIPLVLRRTPRHYQGQGIAAGMQFKRFINGDEPGLGKTLQAIATLVATKATPALVICPATLMINWRNEFAATCDLRVQILTPKLQKTWPLFLDTGLCDVLIINYESLPKYFTTEIKKEEGKKLTLRDIKFRPEIKQFKTVILDESHKCFPYETKVLTNQGPMAIGDIVEKNLTNLLVCSFDITTNSLTYKSIKNVWRNELSGRHLYKLTHSKGELYATENHEIYTSAGRKKALSEIQSGESLLALPANIFSGKIRENNSQILQQSMLEQVCGMQRENESSGKRKMRKKLYPKSNRNLRMVQRCLRNDAHRVLDGQEVLRAKLLSKMENDTARGISGASNRRINSKAKEISSKSKTQQRPFGIQKQQNEGRKEPNEQSSIACKNDCIEQRQNVSFKGWEWSADSPTIKTMGGAEYFQANFGVSYPYSASKRPIQKSAKQLQSRYRNRINKVGNRSGRRNSQHKEVEVFRQAQNGNLECVRVDSVEIYKPTSPEQFGYSSVRNQVVYDLEIEDTHNYFADGILVSNCKDTSTRQAKMCKGICHDKEYVIMLTGTPVMNNAKDLISQLAIMNQLQALGGYKHFYNRYCGGNGKESTNLKELHYKLATTCFFRRLKKDVLTELPDKSRRILTCDITNRKEYNDAMADFATYLREYTSKTDEEIRRSMRAEILVRMNKCRNISARGKMNEVVEYIDEVVDAGEKVIVFIHQKEIALKLMQHYPTAVTVRGDDDKEARSIAIDKFQTDPNTKIIICSIKAAGVGITLTASSRVAMVEQPWTAADCDQCEDRAHRLGQKNAVEITYFLGADTIDEYMYDIIESKRNVANEVTGTPDDIQRILINKLIEKLGL
jgi:hypothetical protein